MKTYIALFAALLALTGAHGASAENDPQIGKLTERVREVLPGAKVTGVKPTPIPGLFEISIGPTILYMTPDGKYAFRGDIFDLQAKRNITEERRFVARTEAFKALGAESAIRFEATGGKARHDIYVFTDIDCGYCRKMHKEIKQLNSAGVSVNYLAFPRSGLDGESYDKAVAVWCSDDRQSALTEAKNGRKLKSAKCANPVAEHFQLGEAMGVRGTPTVFSSEGEELGGYIPAKELAQLLNGG
jgi:thiol:disulfide interchange protein DsbC